MRNSICMITIIDHYQFVLAYIPKMEGREIQRLRFSPRQWTLYRSLTENWVEFYEARIPPISASKMLPLSELASHPRLYYTFLIRDSLITQDSTPCFGTKWNNMVSATTSQSVAISLVEV